MGGESGRMEQLSPVKRALLEIRELRERLAGLERSATEPIAVTGVGCRFPGEANGPDSYWNLLRSGIDAVGEVPADRWDVDAFYDPDTGAPGKIATRWGGFLREVDLFDPEFFGISPREAESMDPQQRLLMEVTWNALEHAGLAPEELRGSRGGVFIGIGTSDYLMLRARQKDREGIDAYMTLGTVSHSVASGRLAYLLGLQGPAMSVDTACSSSLVAVHLACQALRNNECTMALAGGVSIILAPENSISLSKAGMMAADGRCKAFDSRADGFVRAEGCGVVVLKRYADALADGDRVLALIRGSAVNQDGRSSGLTVPNGPAQEAVIRQALANGGVDPLEVSYVEAHGTGTELGDPIEVQALAGVLGEGRSQDARLQIGSVKTNLGHPESAAGIAGLIKVVLSLMHREIPPHLHFEKPNPHIRWEDYPVEVTAQGRPWEALNGKRIGGVSSFGFSGTNAHVVLAEAPPAAAKPAEVDRPLHVLALSARSPRALEELAGRYGKHLAEHREEELGDICFTANSGRARLSSRLALVGSNAAEVAEKLSRLGAGEEVPGVSRGDRESSERPKVAFLCTGQGSQSPGMGRELYETQPTFRQAMEKCGAILEPHLEKPLLAVLYGGGPEGELLGETAYTQPALFALEYSLARLWKSWGLEPSVVLGHSVGEYVAACLAGVMSLEAGLRLIAERGRLMQSLPGGGQMAAVFADESRVREALKGQAGHVSVAALNGPESVVISGAAESVEQVLKELEGAGVSSQRLVVSHAFHSPLMEPILDEFERAAGELEYGPARIGWVSNVTGGLMRNDQPVGARYWRDHVRGAVRFREGMEALARTGVEVYVELGPHPTLLGMGRGCVAEGTALWVPSLRRGRGDWEQLLESVAQLSVHGVDFNWKGFDRDYPRRRVSLPTYPFQRERYWIGETGEAVTAPPAGQRWNSVVASGRWQATQVPVDLHLHTYAAKWESLDRLATACIRKILVELGAFTSSGQTYSVDQLLETCGIVPAYGRLLGRWLARLATEGLLEKKGDRFSCRQPLDAPPLDAIQAEVRERLADAPEILNYIEHSTAALAPVLTGKESPLETLFPGGTFKLAKGIYHDWSVSRYFNAIVRAMAVSAASARHDRPFRVLEVGAGTGGTSASILPALPAGRTEYYFTDMSEVFFDSARQMFGDYPFVRYGLLDIERGPREQGFGSGTFDVVVASNVLHATRSLDTTIDNVLSLLAPAGLLLLFETTSQPAWFDISFGLIEGWHRHEDDLRGDTPLLGAEQWERILRRKGFEDVAVFPDSGPAAQLFFHRVLAACGPAGGIAGPAVGVSPSRERPEKRGASSEDGAPVATGDFREELGRAPASEQRELLVEYVRDAVRNVLRMGASKTLGRKHRLMDLGFDSLMAVELRNLLGQSLKLEKDLPATLVFDFPTVEAIAGLLSRELGLAPDADGGAPPDKEAEASEERKHEAAADAIRDLSEEEMEQLILKKLETL